MLSHERPLSYCRESVACQFRSCFFCVVAWSSVRSIQLASVHSDDNKSRHYHFNWGPSPKQGEGNIFVRWKNNLWSFYVPLRTLENNNTPQQRQQQQQKGTKCYKSDGICIFFLPHKDQAGEITQEGRKWFLKKHSEAPEFILRRMCFSTTHFLIEKHQDFKVKPWFFLILVSERLIINNVSRCACLTFVPLLFSSGSSSLVGLPLYFGRFTLLGFIKKKKVPCEDGES